MEHEISYTPIVLEQEIKASRSGVLIISEDLHNIELAPIPELRVSTAGFVQIEDGMKRQLVIINQERLLRGGKRELTPIGGGIEATDEGAETIKSLLGIDSFESKRAPRDLRFVTSGDKLNVYREWLLSSQGRELDPTREVVEELTQEALNESGPLLNEEDLVGMVPGTVKYATQLAKTEKTGLEGVITLRFVVITPMVLSSSTMAKLEAMNQPGSLVRLVSAKEILDGKTTDGEAIGEVAKSLIINSQTIPELH